VVSWCCVFEAKTVWERERYVVALNVEKLNKLLLPLLEYHIPERIIDAAVLAKA
jgi:hypothetical protein